MVMLRLKQSKHDHGKDGLLRLRPSCSFVRIVRGSLPLQKEMYAVATTTSRSRWRSSSTLPKQACCVEWSHVLTSRLNNKQKHSHKERSRTKKSRERKKGD